MIQQDQGEFTQLLGSETAETDELLHECFVEPPNDVANKLVLTGRWGTGKTAYMFHRTEALSQLLRSVSPSAERIWYIPENSIDLTAIDTIRENFGGHALSTKQSIEALWEAAIIRSYVSQLSILRKAYGNPQGFHWDEIEKIYNTHVHAKPIWQIASSAIEGIFGGHRAKILTSVLDSVASLRSDSLKFDISKCRCEIPKDMPRPMVAVEPIEAPSSSIESETYDVAGILITALGNTFVNLMETNPRAQIPFIAAIPWHRFKKEKFDRPQKLSQHVGQFNWEKARLRAFINKRLEYELVRTRGAAPMPRGVDAWEWVFGRWQRNHRCKVIEDTFDYVIRHTGYRTRDVLRFTRKAIEYEADSHNKSAFEMLERRGERIVSEGALRKAVSAVSKETAQERITEGARIFPEFSYLIDAIQALSSPFKIEDIRRRAERAGILVEGDNVNVMHLIEQLWSAGIIGARVATNSEEIANQLANKFGEQTKARNPKSISAIYSHKSLGEDVNDTKWEAVSAVGRHRFFFYVHNQDFCIGTDGIIKEVGNFDLEARDSLKLDWVFHPMMFERLGVGLPEAEVVGV